MFTISIEGMGPGSHAKVSSRLRRAVEAGLVKSFEYNKPEFLVDLSEGTQVDSVDLQLILGEFVLLAAPDVDLIVGEAKVAEVEAPVEPTPDPITVESEPVVEPEAELITPPPPPPKPAFELRIYGLKRDYTGERVLLEVQAHKTRPWAMYLFKRENKLRDGKVNCVEVWEKGTTLIDRFPPPPEKL